MIQSINQSQSQFTQKGNELAQKMSQGFRQGGTQVIEAVRTVLSQAANVASSMSGQFVSVGQNMASGIASGISAGSGAIQAAANRAVSSAVSSARNIMNIRSPSKVMAAMVGKPISEGVAVGILEAQHTIESSMQTVSDAITEKMVQRYEDLDHFEQAKVREKYQKLKDLNISNIATVYEMIKELHLQKTEEVENQLADLEEELANARKDKAEQSRIEEIEADIALYEEKKKNLDDYNTHFTETYEKIVSEYEDAVKQIEDKTNRLADKLRSYGDVIEVVRDAEGNVIKDRYGNDMLKLTDLDAQIRQIANYGTLLEQLEARGADVDVMSKMLQMSVDDAVKYGQLLMEQSDRDWDKYMRDMQTKRTMAQNIAKKYYQQELDTLNQEYTQKLTGNLEEIVGTSQEIGENSATALADGFKANSQAFESEVSNLINRMKNAVDMGVAQLQGQVNVAVSQMNTQMANQMAPVVNVYGADYGNRNQARDYGRDMYEQYEREYRRRGGVF